jgi:hypothetical protein
VNAWLRDQNMQILISASLYFAVVFGVGFVLGPIRVFWLEPRLGPTIAVLCEVPLLLVAMVVSARWIANRCGLRKDCGSLVVMGIAALVLQQIADFAVGFMLRGMTPAQQLANFATPAGLIYLGSLVAFAAMPAIVSRT